MMKRPHTTVVLAMSADGKIADAMRSPTGLGSANDKAHLAQQVALVDGILLGATTVRMGEISMQLANPELLQQREQQGKPPQPVSIVCSSSADINPHLRFFSQSIPRWLLTTEEGANRWQDQPGFDRILVSGTPDAGIDWQIALSHLADLGMERLAVLGGGALVASLMAADLIDEFWLTVCPLILGGTAAPTPVDGVGFATQSAPHLELLSAQQIEQELFLHYRLQRNRE